MRIERAETMLLEIPFELHGSGVGIMPTAWRTLDFMLVRLEDDRGHVGWGEGFGYHLTAASRAVADRLILPTLVGAEVEDVPAWNLAAQRAVHMFGRFGVTVFALSGVDMALWDLAAKRRGEPLHALLGGAARREVPLYASLVRFSDAGIVSDMARRASGAGFDRIKLHETGLPEIEAARAAAPGASIALDVNCGWSEAFLAEHEARLAAVAPEWVEEPVFPPEDFGALARLRGGPFAIAAGENLCTARQCGEMLGAGAVDVFQPSVTKVGGVSEYVAALDAAPGGVRLCPHSPYFGPGLHASLHVAAARPRIEALEWNFVEPAGWLTDWPARREGPVLAVDDRPGLGFEPDEAALARWRTAG